MDSTSRKIAEMNFVANEPPAVILVMGVTGSGKSTFINLLAGEKLAQTSRSLFSCTSRVHGQMAVVGNTRVLLVDTPGFDDTFRSDAEILEQIGEALYAQHEVPWKLKGVIYLHNITNNRVGRSAMKTMNIFIKICGLEALSNVVLVTTHWDKVDAEGPRRETELREQIWTYMLSNNASMARSYGDSDSAIGIVSQLLQKDAVVLDMQRELLAGKQLKDTAAGAEVNGDIEALKREYQNELRDLENTRIMVIKQDAARRCQLLQELENELKKLRSAQQQVMAQQQVLSNKPSIKIGSMIAKVKIFLPLIGPVLRILGLVIGLPTSATDGVLDG